MIPPPPSPAQFDPRNVSVNRYRAPDRDNRGGREYVGKLSFNGKRITSGDTGRPTDSCNCGSILIKFAILISRFAPAGDAAGVCLTGELHGRSY